MAFMRIRRKRSDLVGRGRIITEAHGGWIRHFFSHGFYLQAVVVVDGIILTIGGGSWASESSTNGTKITRWERWLRLT